MGKVAEGYTEIVLDIKEQGADKALAKFQKLDGFIDIIQKKGSHLALRFDSKNMNFKDFDKIVKQMSKPMQSLFKDLNNQFYDYKKGVEDELFKLQGNVSKHTWKAMTSGYTDKNGNFHAGDRPVDKRRKINQLKSQLKDLTQGYNDDDGMYHEGYYALKRKQLEKVNASLEKDYLRYKQFIDAGFDTRGDGFSAYADYANLDIREMYPSDLENDWKKTRATYALWLQSSIEKARKFYNSDSQLSKARFDTDPDYTFTGKKLLGNKLQSELQNMIDIGRFSEEIIGEIKSGHETDLSQLYFSDGFGEINSEYYEIRRAIDAEQRSLDNLKSNQKKIDEIKSRHYQSEREKRIPNGDIGSELQPTVDSIEDGTKDHVDIKVNFIPSLDELKLELQTLANGEYTINFDIQDFETKFLQDHKLTLDVDSTLNDFQNKLTSFLTEPHKVNLDGLDELISNKSDEESKKKSNKKKSKATIQDDDDDEESKKITINEGLEIKDKLLSAFDKSGYDVKQFKVLQNGMVEFSIKFRETGEIISNVVTKIKDLESVLDVDGTFIDGFLDEQSGTITTKYNKKPEPKKTVETKKPKEPKPEPKKISLDEGMQLESKMRTAFDKSGFDIGYFKILSNGMVELSGKIRETGKEFSNVRLKVSDVDKLLSQDGLLKKDFFKDLSGDITTKYSGRLNKNLYQQKLMDIVQKSGMEINKESIKLFEDGSMSFIRMMKDKNGINQRYKYNIGDLLNEDYYKSIVTQDGKFNQGFIDSKDHILDVTTQVRAMEEMLNRYQQVNDKMMRMDFLGIEDNGNEVHTLLNARRKEIEDFMNDQGFSQKEMDAVYKRIDNFNRLSNAKKDVVSQDQKNSVLENISNLEYLIQNSKAMVGSEGLFIKDGEVANIKELDAYLTQLLAKVQQIKSAFDNDRIIDSEDFARKLKALDSYQNSIMDVIGIGANGRSYGDIDLHQRDAISLKKSIYDRLTQFGYKNINFKDYNLDKGIFNVSYKDLEGNLAKSTIKLERYTKAAKQAGDATKDIFVTGERMVEQGKTVDLPVSKGQQWINSWKAKAKSLTQYISGIELISGAWQEVKQGFTFVKDLDSLMTTIYQTSDLTKKDFGSLKQGAIDQAIGLGTNVNQVSGAIEVYTAYGETVDSLLKKSSPTTMLAKAADVDVKVASDQIQGVLQQFPELEGHEEKIVNTYEKIAANIKKDFKVAIQDMAEGVQTAGSIAEESGLSFDLFAASVAKTAEVTRFDGSKIGNAMKTILARTSRVKVPGEDVSPEARSKTAAALHSVGIDIYNAKGEYQDFSITLDQLAEKWTNLSDATKSNIGENMAGVRNLNILNALMDNWKEIRELASQVEGDPDFYLEVQEKSMDSLQSKTDTLRASMQDFWNTIFDPDSIGDGVSALSNVLGLFNDLLKISKKLSLVGDKLPGLFIGALGLGLPVFMDNWAKVRQDMKNNNLNPGLFGGVKKGFSDTLQGAKTLFLKNKSDDNDIFSAISRSFDSFNAKAPIKSLTNGFSNLWTQLSGFGKLSLVIAGITASIELLKAGIEAAGDSTRETAEKTSKFQSEINKNNKTLKEGKEFINDYGSEWSRLSKGVDLDNGENISLNEKDFARYQELTNKIAQIMPSAVSGFDAEGNAILDVANNLKSLNEEYEKLLYFKSIEGTLNSETLIEDFKNKTGHEGLWTELNNKIKGEKGTYYLESEDFYKRLTKDKKSLPDFNKRDMTVSDFIDELYEVNAEDSMDNPGLNNANKLKAFRVLDDLKKSGINSSAKMTEDIYQSLLMTESNIIDNYGLAADEAANNIRMLMQNSVTKYMNNPNGTPFDNVNLRTKENVQKYLNNIDTKTLEDLIIDKGINPDAFVASLLSSLNEAKPEVREKFNEMMSRSGDDFFTLQEKNKIFPDVAKLFPNIDQETLRNQFGLSEIDEMTDKYKDLKKVINKDLLDKFITERSIKTSKGFNTLEEAIDNVNRAGKNLDMTSLSSAFNVQSASVENFTERLNMLADTTMKVQSDFGNMYAFLEHSFSPSGLFTSDIKGFENIFGNLEGFDYDQLFQSTYTGVQLNKTYFDKLKGQYRAETLKQYDDELENLNSTYRDVCREIDNVTKANDGLNDSMEISSLIEKRNATADAIEKAKEEKALVMGTLNELAMYEATKSNKIPHEGMVYQELLADFSNNKKDDSIQNLYANQWFGDEKFKAWTQLWSNKDLSGMGSYEVKAEYEKQVGLMNSWLGEGQAGLNNFVQAVNAKYAGFIGEDNKLDTSVLPSISELADTLEVSEPLIEEMFRALNRSGEDLNFEDMNDALSNAKYDAQKALEGFDEEHKLDINLDELDKIEDVDSAIEKVNKALEENQGDTEMEKSLGQILDYLHLLRGEKVELEFDFNSEDGINKLNALVDKVNKSTKAEIKVDWKETNPEYFKEKQEEYQKVFDKTLKKNDDGKISLDSQEGQDAYQLQKALYNKSWQLDEKHNLSLGLDTSKFEGDAEVVATKIQALQGLASQINFAESQSGQFDNSAELENLRSQYNALVDEIKSENPEIVAKLKLDDSEEVMKLTPKQLEKKINELIDDTKKPDKKIEVEAEVKGKEKIQELKRMLNSLQDKIVTIVTQHIDTYEKVHKGSSGQVHGGSDGSFANGTAHINGTAFAHGKWGSKKSGTSLLGELGREIVVRGDQWFTVGDNGAEFENIQKGDIIFNHRQTEELLKNGYVTSNYGRAKMANVNGNAYVNGTAYAKGSLDIVTGGGNGTWGPGGHNGVYYPTYSGGGNGGAAKKAKDDTDELLDWIEIMIDRFERKIDRIDTIIDSTYQTFEKRHQGIVDNFRNVTEEIELQEAAAKRYREEAERVGLSEAYKQKIRNGELSVENITDKELKKLIDKYQELYEKALDCDDAVVDLKETLGELVETNFENVATQFDGLIEGVEHKLDMLEGQLDIIESKGNFAGKAYFEDLMKEETNNIALLEEKYQKLQDARNEALFSKAIEEGSEADVDMQNEINDVAKAWQDAKQQMIEYKNEMWEADWNAFEWAQDRISDITAESDFVQGLLGLGENDLFIKETGRLNTKGNTTGALHAMNYDIYMAQADEYRKKVEEINAELANDPNNTILLDKKKEYIEAQRDSIEAANDEKMAIHDLIEESYQRMLDVLQELIDKRKEALQKEKDLYDFQKDVKEQTKNITDLQKQLMAIQGDDSEEAKAKKQELQDELEKAQQDLEETQYDRYLSDQEELMDKMYEEAEKLFNDRLDNIDGLLQSMIDYGNDNSELVNSTIQNATDKVGYNINEGFGQIWNNTNEGVNKVLSMYGDNFVNLLTYTNRYIKGVFDVLKDTTHSKVEVEKPKDTTKPNDGGDFKPKPEPKPEEQNPSKPKEVTIGATINAGGARIYGNQYGQGGGTQYFANDPVYVVVGKENGYLLTRWHGASYGYTGWFKESDVTAMKTGGYTGAQEGMAMLHKKERVLSAQQTKAFDSLVYGLLPALSDNLTKINGVSSKGNVQNVSVGDIHFELPNVTDSQTFMKELQNNKKFTKLVQSMVLDPINGKGALSKHKIKL